MGRTPCCNALGLKKGAWTADEDQKLIAYINEHGEGGWRTLPQKAGLSRCGKSCRLRWANYLSPAIKRGQFSSDEEQTIINLHATLGNRWSVIARHLPRRTDNEIKNYWNTNLKKRLTKMNADPTTHDPIGPTSSVSDHMIPVRPSPSEPNSSPSTSSRPISRSANFLNKVASQLVPAGRLETVHAIVSSNGSSPWTITKDVNCNDDPDPDVVPKSRISEPASGSAKLLNKMATRLGSPRLGISKLKSILLPKSAEVGSSDFRNIEASECNLNSEQSTSTSATSEHGWSSFDNLESLHSPDLLNDWQVFCSNASECGDDGGCGGGDVSDVNMESQMSGLHFEWNNNYVAGCDSHELFGNCQPEYTLFDNML